MNAEMSGMLREMNLARAFRTFAFLVGGCIVGAGVLHAQQPEYRLDESGKWVLVSSPEPGTDEATIAKARSLYADKKYDAAVSLLDQWIELNEFKSSPYLPQAFLLRGDAKTARSDEYAGLLDYERVVNDFPASEEFVTALEREFDTGSRYLNGLRRRVFGLFRLDSGVPIGEEIMLRINERLPGSRLAERALIELADFYYRTRDLRMAAETYDAFLTLFPTSDYRQKAMQRRVYATIARFKGPAYDATGLLDAKIQIMDFTEAFPDQAEQAGMSDALVARLDESAAATMLETARWYLKRSDTVSARLELRRLVRKFPHTAAAARAAELMQKISSPHKAERKEPDGAERSSHVRSSRVQPTGGVR